MIRNLRWGDVAQLKYGKSIRNYPEVPSESHRFRVFGTNGPIGWHTSPLVQTAGIVIGRKRAYRGVHFSDAPFFVIDTAYYLEIHDPDLDVKWAYYQLLTVDINRMDSGCAIPSTKREDFDSVAVRIPPLSTQKRIADILSAYDDLIENNRRRMALLEESARQLYQEWFVRLRFPGHEHTRVVDGVPEGWTRKTIGDYYNTSSGATPSRKVPEHFTGHIPWVKTGELRGGFVIDTEEKITEDAVRNSATKFFPMRIVLVALYGATVGALGILGMPATTNQACCAVISTGESPGFAFAYVTLAHNRDRFVGLSAGAAQKNISQQLVREFPLLVGSQTIQEAFNRFIEPSFDQIENLLHQNQKLRAARDLLLPRLMSGEVTV